MHIPKDSIDPGFRASVQAAEDFPGRVGDRDFYFSDPIIKIVIDHDCVWLVRSGEVSIAVQSVISPRAGHPLSFGLYLEKMNIFIEDFIVQFLKRGDVGDIEATAVSSHD